MKIDTIGFLQYINHGTDYYKPELLYAVGALCSPIPGLTVSASTGEDVALGFTTTRDVKGCLLYTSRCV